jgi:hypothetical protein
MAMTPILTDEQRRALQTTTAPVRVLDPQTNETYVLLRAEVYERIKDLVEPQEEEFDIREAYPLMDEVARKEGWEDPEMDCYNEPESGPRP